MPQLAEITQFIFGQSLKLGYLTLQPMRLALPDVSRLVWHGIGLDEPRYTTPHSTRNAQPAMGGGAMTISEVKALTFDVFGTVVNWRDSIAREAKAILGPMGYDGDWYDFADKWRAGYQPAMTRVRNGERPWTRLDDLHRENLLELLPEFGVLGLSTTEIDDLNRAWHRLDPWPDVIEGLTRLKRKYILVTLSNGNVSLMVNMAKYAGLPWDAILGAETARAYKPQPEAYDRTAAFLDLRSGQCMMVAAHNGDLLAARNRGFCTAFVSRPLEHGPIKTRDVKAEHDFDIVADNFLDLAGKLGC